jgi:cytochrome c-type biogenesis protein CcmH
MLISALVVVVCLLAAILVLATVLQLYNQPKSSQIASCNKHLNDIERRRIAGELDEAAAEQERLAVLRDLLMVPLKGTVRFGWISTTRATINLLGLTALPLALVLAAYSADDYQIGAVQVARSDENSIDDVYANLRAYAESNVVQTRTPQRASLPRVDTMIRHLADRLKSSPDDAEGWRMLGWSHFNTQKYDDAAKAFARAVKLSPDNADWQSAYGEALVKTANGMIPPKAMAAFDRSLALDSSNLRSRYYKGLAKQNSDDAAGALEIWRAMLKEVKGNESWLPDLQRNAKALATEQGQDSNEFLHLTNKGPTANKYSREKRGPTPEDIASANQMAHKDRQAMIRNMVDGLDERLAKNPRDTNGWIKLMRSRMVLGQREKAKTTLTKALEAFSGEEKEREKIVSAAKELGVDQD